MENLSRYSHLCIRLENIFNHLNKDFFNDELETPVITVMSTKGSYGHITTSKIWKDYRKLRYELNIDADTLDIPLENIVATMLHESVHLYHLMHGIQDTSRGNTYHNKKFKEKAESVGLIIDYDSKIGWSIIKPSPELIEYVKSKNWRPIELTRSDGSTAERATRQKKASSTRKYICPCCSQSVRATKDTLLICGYCSELMTKVE